jgi:hypothetical protein
MYKKGDNTCSHCHIFIFKRAVNSQNILFFFVRKDKFKLPLLPATFFFHFYLKEPQHLLLSLFCESEMNTAGTLTWPKVARLLRL